MALTFPRAFPACDRFETVSFGPQYAHARALTGGGNPTVAELGPALWIGSYQVRTHGRAQYGAWDAWLRSLRGGLKLFSGGPFLWRYPLAYSGGIAGLTVGGLPWDGTGTVTAIGAGRDTLTISSLPSTLALGAGDWLSLTAGMRRLLYQVVEGGTAAGGTLTISIEPTLRADVATGVVASFVDPTCDMVLAETPNQSLTPMLVGSFSFSGQQVLI